MGVVVIGGWIDVPALVRQLRTDAGLSQARLAEKLNTTQTYISRIERGSPTPTIRTLERIGRACGVILHIEATPKDPRTGRPLPPPPATQENP